MYTFDIELQGRIPFLDAERNENEAKYITFKIFTPE
jgi:hypothetical protein